VIVGDGMSALSRVRSGCHQGQSDDGVVADGRDAFQCDVAGDLDGPLIVLFEQDGAAEASGAVAQPAPAILNYAASLSGLLFTDGAGKVHRSHMWRKTCMSETSRRNASPDSWDYADPVEKLYQLGTFGIPADDFGLVVKNRHERAERIAGLLQIEPRDVLLDLGSGMGLMAERLAPRVHWMHCADISEVYLADCRQRVAHLKNVETHHIPYADLSKLDDKGVSKAYSALLFIHFNFYDFVYYLKELHRILNPGGLLFFDFNDGDGFLLNNSLDSFNLHIADYKRRRLEWVFGCMQMSSGATLKALLPQLGFEVQAIYPSRSAFTEMVVRKREGSCPEV
jgi:ubiquinone/menaquinone biosynthesis C-methylase UbiE